MDNGTRVCAPTPWFYRALGKFKIPGPERLRNVGLGTTENPIPIRFNPRRMHLIFFTEHSVKYVPQAWVIEKCPIGFNRRHIHLNFFTPG